MRAPLLLALGLRDSARTLADAVIDDGIAWQGEKLQEQLRASVAALRAP